MIAVEPTAEGVTVYVSPSDTNLQIALELAGALPLIIKLHPQEAADLARRLQIAASKAAELAAADVKRGSGCAQCGEAMIAGGFPARKDSGLGPEARVCLRCLAGYEPKRTPQPISIADAYARQEEEQEGGEDE